MGLPQLHPHLLVMYRHTQSPGPHEVSAVTSFIDSAKQQHFQAGKSRPKQGRAFPQAPHRTHAWPQSPAFQLLVPQSYSHSYRRHI